VLSAFQEEVCDDDDPKEGVMMIADEDESGVCVCSICILVYYS
jgi:hypothetical protein